jgi:hypothetical protein
MRTLTSTLTSAQQSNSRKPCPKIVLTSGATSYTYEVDRILSLLHSENENSHQANLELQNADGTLTSLSLKGYSAVISHGLESKASKEYSAAAPLKVIGQKLDSSEGILRCTLQMAGIPDLLSEDKASADYEHNASSVKTVKDLITEIASGTAVSEDLTVSQTTGTSQQILYTGETIVLGQRITISATVKSLSFKLKRVGNPSGDVYFKIWDPDTEAELGSKKLSAASAVSNSTATWYKATFDTPVVLDQAVYIGVLFDSGDASNYIIGYYKDSDVLSNENMIIYDSAFGEYSDQDCAYKYEYSYAGISVFSHCTAYTATFDSEDSLIDTYCPANSFTIRENEDRLSVIDRLLFYTGCQRRFEADGEIHIFVATITGTTYDSEYSLASGHPFFSKAIRDALVIPNKVYVRSLKGETALEGSATSAASYALLPVNDYQRTYLTSSEQGTSIATAIISRLELGAQQGGASIPVDCGAELYDYVKVTDSRESDYRVGNIGSITRTYKNYPGRKPEYSMSFSFGRVATKSVRGSITPSFTISGLSRRESDGSIPWGELWVWMDEVQNSLRNLFIAMGWMEAETPADEQITDALVGFLKNIVEDTTPQLGGNLDCDSKNITNLGYLDSPTYLRLKVGNVTKILADGIDIAISDPIDMAVNKITNMDAPTADADAATKKYVDDNAGISSIVEDTSPQLGGGLDANGHAIDMDSQRIVSLAAPETGTDAVNRDYCDANVGLTDIVEDTTPQLGGDLDTNGKNIVLKDTGAATRGGIVGTSAYTGITISAVNNNNIKLSIAGTGFIYPTGRIDCGYDSAGRLKLPVGTNKY